MDAFAFMQIGGNARARRLQICRSLLQMIGPEQRFAVSARLTQDVLAAVVDEVMPLTKPVRRVLPRKCPCGSLFCLALSLYRCHGFRTERWTPRLRR